jgi:hypothetical protein
MQRKQTALHRKSLSITFPVPVHKTHCSLFFPSTTNALWITRFRDRLSHAFLGLGDDLELLSRDTYFRLILR